MSEETTIQINFIDECKSKYPDLLVMRIPNDAKRTKKNGYWSRRMGTVAGACDIFIPALKLWIEFKSKKGKLTKNQREFIKKIIETKIYRVVITSDRHKTIKIIEKLLKKYNGL